MYQEIQFHSSFCFDSSNLFSNNKVFFLPTSDAYLLAVLNSPLMWWHNWRYLPHMKDEALSPVGVLMATLPIALPTEIIRAEVEEIVARLMKMRRTGYEMRRLMLDWLRTEFEVQEPGTRLENVTELEVQVFIEEVRKRRPKTAKRLTLAALKDLQTGYAEQIAPLQQQRIEALALEYKLNDLINVAYDLTAEEIALLWETAPPRMPLLPPSTIVHPG